MDLVEIAKAGNALYDVLGNPKQPVGQREYRARASQMRDISGANNAASVQASQAARKAREGAAMVNQLHRPKPKYPVGTRIKPGVKAGGAAVAGLAGGGLVARSVVKRRAARRVAASEAARRKRRVRRLSLIGGGTALAGGAALGASAA